jgi:K+-transporting ATPase KdpF subunit
VRAHLNAMLDLILGGVVSAGLLFYLLWALLRPEDL